MNYSKEGFINSSFPPISRRTDALEPKFASDVIIRNDPIISWDMVPPSPL